MLQGTNNAQLIGVPSGARQQLGDGETGLAVPREFPMRCKQVLEPGAFDARLGTREAFGYILAGELGQLGLRIKGIHLARTAGHEPVSYTHLTLPTICSV